jgi:hypothetical protein
LGHDHQWAFAEHREASAPAARRRKGSPPIPKFPKPTPPRRTETGSARAGAARAGDGEGRRALRTRGRWVLVLPRLLVVLLLRRDQGHLPRVRLGSAIRLLLSCWRKASGPSGSWFLPARANALFYAPLACRCQKQFAQYTCPRCNARYCSLSCYKVRSPLASCVCVISLRARPVRLVEYRSGISFALLLSCPGCPLLTPTRCLPNRSLTFEAFGQEIL